MLTDDMTEKQAKDLVREIIESLDELDEDDFFSTEGWRNYLNFEKVGRDY